MQFSFSTIIFFIIIFIVPIFTLNKKFDLYRKFLEYKSKKPSINFIFLSKFFIYFLLIGKLYFTLYVLSYIILNNIFISAISGFVLLGIIILFLYIFWNLEAKNQNLMIKISGILLTSILLIIFSTIFLFFLKNIFLKFSINKELIDIFKIFLNYLVASSIFTFLSFLFAKTTSFFLLKANFQNNKIKKYLYKFFYLINSLSTILFVFLPYLVFKFFLSKTFFIIHNAFKEFFLIILFSIFYSVILVNRSINHRFLTPTKILDRNKLNFFSILINNFFEINILIQFIFFLERSEKNIFYIFLDSINHNNNQKIFFIGLLYFIIYIFYFIYNARKKNVN
jgi:hypothetical protein